ncbi:putative non-specific serine/threonine protein kinase [Helianthus anomalus]
MMKLFFFAYTLVLYLNFAFTQSAELNTQEMEAFKVIGEKLGAAGKKEWELDKDPCSGEQNGNLYVYCNCSFESNTSCHIYKISLTFQNVSTALPSEFTKLPYLTYLDLSRNYLNGTIPSEWKTMHLDTLILVGNRLSGPFPIALHTMTSIRYLRIDGNRFSGPIPEEIANLKNLEKLYYLFPLT